MFSEGVTYNNWIPSNSIVTVFTKSKERNGRIGYGFDYMGKFAFCYDKECMNQAWRFEEYDYQLHYVLSNFQNSQPSQVNLFNILNL